MKVGAQVKSYSLGRLCEYYEIELEDHHRALCDARATAKLLTLINRIRQRAGSEERESTASEAA